jgi:uncharacterized protein (DUF1501 family)
MAARIGNAVKHWWCANTLVPRLLSGNRLSSKLGLLGRLVLDRGLGNLLKELAALGILDETLVVLATEFGRSPGINDNAGRDHHPAEFSVALAGGGIRGGQFYGSSDGAGHSVDQDGVAPADFNSTIASALGLP